jgi:ABC-type glycerol-3-phosphate transport system substrate-binding protein
MASNSRSDEPTSHPTNPSREEAKGRSDLLGRRITRRALIKGSLAALAGAGGARIIAGDRPASAAPAISKPVSIRYWTFLDPKDPGPRSVAQTQMLDLFKKKQPNINVVVEIAPWQTVDRQLLQAAAAGRGPDVVRIFSQNLAMHIPTKTILPLDDFFRYWTKEQREDFIFPWEDTVWNGQKMAFYGDHRVRMLWYRADLLRAKNLKPPRTLEEVAQVAKAVMTDQIVGFGIGLSRGNNATTLMEWFMPALWGMGSRLLNPDETAFFNGEAGVRLFQWLQDMVYKYKVMPAGATAWTGDNLTDMFRGGVVAMTPQGTHRVAAGRAGKGIGKNLQTVPIPTDKADKPAAAYVAGQCYCISKDVKEKEAAWLLIEHLLSPEAEIINARVAGEMPTRKSTYKDPWFQTEEAADLREWRTYINEHGRSIRLPEKFLALSDFIAIAAQEVVGTQVSPKKALDEAAKKWHAEIGRD